MCAFVVVVVVRACTVYNRRRTVSVCGVRRCSAHFLCVLRCIVTAFARFFLAAGGLCSPFIPCPGTRAPHPTTAAAAAASKPQTTAIPRTHQPWSLPTTPHHSLHDGTEHGLAQINKMFPMVFYPAFRLQDKFQSVRWLGWADERTRRVVEWRGVANNQPEPSTKQQTGCWVDGWLAGCAGHVLPLGLFPVVPHRLVVAAVPRRRPCLTHSFVVAPARCPCNPSGRAGAEVLA